MGNQQLILFDGVCVFCNRAVNFIIRRDPENHFVFAPIQSPIGQALLTKYDLLDKPDTFALIHQGTCLSMSDAVIAVAKQFPGLWKAVIIFTVVPKFLRDALYCLFGRYRYRLFGKQQSCAFLSKKSAEAYQARLAKESEVEQW